MPDKVFSHKRLAELAKQAIAAGETSGEGTPPVDENLYISLEQLQNEVDQLKHLAEEAEREGNKEIAHNFRLEAIGVASVCSRLINKQVPSYAAHRLAAAEAANRELRAALENLMAKVQGLGEWDEGCFYVAGTYSGEVQEALQDSRKLLTAGTQGEP